MRSESQQAAALIKSRIGDTPINVGLVVGTGLAAIADHVLSPVAFPYAQLPGFPRPSMGASEAELIVGELGTARVAILKGRSNYHETGDTASMRVPLETLKLLGADAVVLVNAAGSTKPEFTPGSIIVIKDHINLTGLNPLSDFNEADRFVDMSAPYDPTMRERLAIAAGSLSRKMAEGVYMWFPGPTFETPAEVRAAHMLGADLVGMSLVPEVVIARHLGMRVLGISMVTNFASGVGGEAAERNTMRIAGATALPLTRMLVKFFEIWIVGSPRQRQN
jgi:purine-nucleoside phosphorylase